MEWLRLPRLGVERNGMGRGLGGGRGAEVALEGSVAERLFSSPFALLGMRLMTKRLLPF